MRLTFNSNQIDLLDRIQSCLEDDAECYLVGGGVRDILLGRRLHDLDFALPMDPTPLAKKISNRLKADYFVLDDERHTARVVYHATGKDIIPLDFVQFTGASLTEDLINRDFTINAIAVPIRDLSNIFDPLDGCGDLKTKRLRVCKPDALMDDPVRVLRGVRLGLELGFTYTPELEVLMQQAAQHLSDTTYERQRDEFFKILEGPQPETGMAHLHQFQVFETLLPPLLEQEAIPASPPHVLPLLQHTFKVVEYYDHMLTSLTEESLKDDHADWWMSEVISELHSFYKEMSPYFSEEITPGRSVRGLALLGALLHDIGKPGTMELGTDGFQHYFSHDLVGADLAEKLAKRLKLSNAESEWVRTMVRYHMWLLPLVNQSSLPTRRTIYKYFADTDRVGVAIALLSLADTVATYGENLAKKQWLKTVSTAKAMLSAWWQDRDSVVSPNLFLDGHELQRLFNLKPGQQIGQLLAALREAQASGEVTTQEDAIRFIKHRLDVRSEQKDLRES